MSLEYKRKLSKLLIELNKKLITHMVTDNYEYHVEALVDEIFEQIWEGDK